MKGSWHKMNFRCVSADEPGSQRPCVRIVVVFITETERSECHAEGTDKVCLLRGAYGCRGYISRWPSSATHGEHHDCNAADLFSALSQQYRASLECRSSAREARQV